MVGYGATRLTHPTRYWAWNNTLSVAQQSVIMHKHGAKIELWGNLKGAWDGLKNLFKKKVTPA